MGHYLIMLTPYPAVTEHNLTDLSYMYIKNNDATITSSHALRLKWWCNYYSMNTIGQVGMCVLQ